MQGDGPHQAVQVIYWQHANCRLNTHPSNICRKLWKKSPNKTSPLFLCGKDSDSLSVVCVWVCKPEVIWSNFFEKTGAAKDKQVPLQCRCELMISAYLQEMSLLACWKWMMRASPLTVSAPSSPKKHPRWSRFSFLFCFVRAGRWLTMPTG